MTPRQRAEKVLLAMLKETERFFATQLIAAEIQSAVEEAERNMLMTHLVRIQEARAEALEEAAKLTEAYLWNDPNDGQHGRFIANAIRARIPKEKP